MNRFSSEIRWWKANPAAGAAGPQDLQRDAFLTRRLRLSVI
ncbi:hypothetical protein [Azospirillum endophyticum]